MDPTRASRRGKYGDIKWGTRICYHGKVPQVLKKRLKPRKTQIVAFELLAAIMGILQCKQLQLEGTGVRHFVDSNPARQGLVRANSKQPDLNNLIGMVWFVAGKVLRRYWCQYVRSGSNLADAPSRGDFSTVTQIGARVVEADFSLCTKFAYTWISSVEVEALMS